MRIAIDGNIGSGKTFYLNKLQNEGYIVNHEDISKWSQWLQKYHSDMNRYALGFQLQILYDQTQLPYKPSQLNIYERSPYTLKNIFGDMLFEEQLFDKQEYELHNLYVKKIGWKPDVVIYLYCDPDICYERIKDRLSVAGDNQLTVDYLKKLHIKHEIVFDDLNCSIPIYKVNSMEDTETVYNTIVEIIETLKKNQPALNSA